MECEYDAVSKEAEIEEDLPLLIKVYPRRWVVLAVFFSLSVVNSFQWIQYVIITDQIPLALVDWTRMVFMACFIILILPACYALEKMATSSSLWSISQSCGGGVQFFLRGGWVDLYKDATYYSTQKTLHLVTLPKDHHKEALFQNYLLDEEHPPGRGGKTLVPSKPGKSSRG
ncbi:unnamed protein product [Timema podura]|uniref:Uncharacterized protein n=1 Tax=Timema podura TaxID=61482 RepID=A0ABN7NQS5_TIMPD|nr:unnamed protein product [Timema podura]